MNRDPHPIGNDAESPTAPRQAYSDDAPNPGSDAAIARGCKCARMDNSYGRGYMGQPGIFVITENCPLHGGALASPHPKGETPDPPSTEN